MRYPVGLVCVLAGLVALPLSASAQAGEEGTTSEENLQEPAPPSEPAPEEPALQLKLGYAGVEVAPSPVEEMELRVKRARIALGVSVVPLVLGTGLAVAGAFRELDFTTPPSDTSGQDATLYAGSAIVGAGAVWMITSGIVLGVRKRQLRELQQADYGTPRRVQWDLSQSRLVF
jgi:hypothetical protein